MRRAMTHLRAQQRISMLLEELKVLGKSSNGSSSGSQHGSGLLSPSSSVASSPSPSPSLRSVPSTNNLLVPVEHEKRQPVLLFIGGGMGAGKSTVVREIMKRWVGGGWRARGVRSCCPVGRCTASKCRAYAS